MFIIFRGQKFLKYATKWIQINLFWSGNSKTLKSKLFWFWLYWAVSWAVQFYKLSFCIRSKQFYIIMLVSTASLICARNLCLGNVRLLCTSSIPPIPRGMLNLKQVTYILNISTTNSYSTYSINVPTFKKIHTFIAKLEMFYR